jgi:hypothetical protein
MHEPWSVPTFFASLASNTSFENVKTSPALSPAAPVSVVASVVACSTTVNVLPALPFDPDPTAVTAASRAAVAAMATTTSMRDMAFPPCLTETLLSAAR